jgi:hypothetical protein
MRQAHTKMLFDHWQSLCVQGLPPDRNDLDPSRIAGALQDIFILGRGADGIWRYRVAGTRLSAYADRELRSEPFSAWWRPEDRRDIERLLLSTTDDQLPTVGGLEGRAVRGATHAIELIILPLRHGGQNGHRMIGGLFPAAATTREHDVRLTSLSIVSLRSLPAADPRSHSFGHPRIDVDSLVERRVALRVIEGGRSSHDLRRN